MNDFKGISFGRREFLTLSHQGHKSCGSEGFFSNIFEKKGGEGV